MPRAGRAASALAALAALAAAARAASYYDTAGYAPCGAAQRAALAAVVTACARGDPGCCVAASPATGQALFCPGPAGGGGGGAGGCCARVAAAAGSKAVLVVEALRVGGGGCAEPLVSDPACAQCGYVDGLECGAEGFEMPSSMDVPFVPPAKCYVAVEARTDIAASDVVEEGRDVVPMPTAGAEGGGGGAAPAAPTPAVGQEDVKETPGAEEAAAAATAAGGAESNCFPAAAEVVLADGRTVSMDRLEVGDVVQTGVGAYSPVFAFTHRQPAGARAHAYTRIATACGQTLTLTPGHYLYVNGALAAAASVAPGDVVALAGGGACGVARVRRVVEAGGVYNPQTVAGDVVVDGVVCSTYTRAVRPALAHAVLAPLRAAYALGGWRVAGLERAMPAWLQRCGLLAGAATVV